MRLRMFCRHRAVEPGTVPEDQGDPSHGQGVSFPPPPLPLDNGALAASTPRPGQGAAQVFPPWGCQDEDGWPT